MSKPTLIVAVGASAGGLEAFTELLSGIPGKPGFAIVFVQHLDPSKTSLVGDLLRRQTSLPVEEITTGKKVKPNTIYLCPPRGRLDVVDGELKVSQQSNDDSEANVIDHFFHGIAESQGGRGIGVVLSGSGSDGTLGLKSIGDAGGMTFAQDSESAKFDSMPRNAATTGVADQVMPPANIATELLRYTRYLEEISETPAKRKFDDQIRNAIPQIAKALLSETGHNFKHYKTSTLARRIQRRMQILKLSDVDAYVTLLHSDKSESQQLFRELLISVTAFFRDPDSFKRLADQVIPKLFENRQPDDPARIWVPGCATGEEAYTIAILCREFVEKSEAQKHEELRKEDANWRGLSFQIFASDIDERALSIARTGVYPAGIADHVSKDRLKRFFVKKGNRYHVKKEIRETVLFSSHNLISDPPFSRQDLICCRNLLIYLGPHLQKKLIPLFHFALRPNGFLFLGPSESISTHGDLFRSIDQRHRISQRKGTAIGRAAPLALRTPANGMTRLPEVSPIDDDKTDVVQIMQRIVLDEFAPKSVVVDEDGQVICSSAETNKYLSIGEGAYQNNILKMARRGLRIGLRATLSEAKSKRRRIIHENLSVTTDEGKQRVMITVQPMMRLGEDTGLFIVVFHDVGLPMGTTSGEDSPIDPNDVLVARGSMDRQAEAMVEQLERELSQTRDDLEKTMQEMEATNEELKSSNEELLSMNEELQSANEELETSKEEIRSSSEAVSRANADLENLLRSTQIATIFLDSDGLIRSFTQAATEIYSLIATDVGRPLGKFVPDVHDMPPLPSIRQLKAEGPVEDTITANDGRMFIRRVLPYQSHSRETDGMVVTFVDVSELEASRKQLSTLVTELRTTQRQLIEYGEQLDLAMQAGRLGAWRWDVQSDRVEWSPQLYALFGRPEGEFDGTLQAFVEIVHPDDRDRVRDVIEQTLASDSDRYEVECRMLRPDGSELWTLGLGLIDRDEDGKPLSVTGTASDITDRKRRELNLAFIADLQQAFIPLSDVGELQAIACRMVGEHFSASRCCFVKFDDDADCVRVVRDHAVDDSQSLVGCYHLQDFHTDEERHALQTGRPVVIRDVDAEAKSDRGERFKALDIQSLCNVGFRSDGNVQFLLSTIFAEPHDWHRDEIELLQDVVDRLSVRVQRAEAETELALAKTKMDLAMQAASVASWTWDFDAGDLVHEPNLNRLWGFDPATPVPTADFVAAIDNDHRERVSKAIGKALDEGGLYDEEYLVLRTDGQRRWLRAVGIGTAPGKEPREFLGVVTDTTARKQNEIELAERETHLRRVIDNTLNFVGELDRDGTLLQVNQTALDAGGVTREDVIGKPFWECYWWSHDGEVTTRLREAVEMAATGKIVRYDVSVRMAGDTRMMIDFMLAPVTDSDGKVTHLIPSGVDISDRHAAEQQAANSRRLLTDAMSAAKMGSFTYKPQTGESDWDENWADLMGLSVDSEKMAQHLFEIIHPDDLGASRRRFEEAVETRAEFKHEFRIIRSDGELRWIAARGQVTYDEFGEAVLLSGINWDITDQKLFEQEIQLNEERVRQAAGAAGFGTFCVDVDNNLVTYSDEFKKLVGLSPSEELSNDIQAQPAFVHPDDRDMLARHTQSVLSDVQEPDHWLNHRIVRHDGKLRYVRMQSRSLYEGEGKDRRVRMVVGTLLDITQQHDYEQNLKKAKRVAEAANRSKSEFVANMSHEIRTPMTAILGYADMVQDRVDDDETRGYLQTIRRNGAYLLEIINDILDLSKIEAGKLEIDTERFEPARVVEDVRSIMEVRASDGGLKLEVDYATPIPNVIESDAKRLKQILINLVGNAIKFTKEGGVRIEVAYEDDSGDRRELRPNDDPKPLMSSATGQLRLSVSDTGIGMTPEQRDRLFKPFSQGDSLITQQFGGTGLGLAISQRLASMLGGEITCDSKLNQGSTFTVTVSIGDLENTPLIQPWASAEIGDSDSAASNDRPEIIRLAADFLIVDDRRDIRFLAKHIITKAGGSVTEAEDGLVAIETVKQAMSDGKTFDLILLDMQMPNMDGYETAAALRRLGYIGPIIALTADAMQGDMNKCLQAGCNDYLSKPIDAQRMLQLVSDLTKK
tara:strand:- start:3446 stop:9706 length:6261 start_codon:yes stop_codon:yes gene_type:complete